MAEPDERSWMEGEPAFLLDEGIAYVRAWARGERGQAGNSRPWPP
ncbi:MAG TPA: hypothetical protein VMV92_20680 [Streptosporangiaceae bacterium]|nr:hypothetical protein [Streptosporangiaceae bacterium]